MRAEAFVLNAVQEFMHKLRTRSNLALAHLMNPISLLHPMNCGRYGEKHGYRPFRSKMHMSATAMR